MGFIYFFTDSLSLVCIGHVLYRQRNATTVNHTAEVNSTVGTIHKRGTLLIPKQMLRHVILMFKGMLKLFETGSSSSDGAKCCVDYTDCFTAIYDAGISLLSFRGTNVTATIRMYA